MLSANRVAALGAFFTGLGAAVAGGVGALPANWSNGALAVAGVLGAIGTSMHFMLGAQKSEALQSNVAEARAYAAAHAEPTPSAAFFAAEQSTTEDYPLIADLRDAAPDEE